MAKNDGKTLQELSDMGYRNEPDGRLRKGSPWKSECPRCKLWFGKLRPIGDGKGTCLCGKCFRKAATSGELGSY